jgi:flagellar biosynthesis protein FliR
MPADPTLLFGFLLVFVRCSAMLLSSPVFGAQNTPLPVRIMTTLAISGALTAVLTPKLGPPPADMNGLVVAVAHEAMAGLLLGTFVSLALQAAQIAGAFLDLQIGLGSSQILNPATGVSVTVISQFKFMLGVVIFLSFDGHHLMLQAFAASYDSAAPISMAVVQASVLTLVRDTFLLALQIAAPVLAVSVIIDASLGLMSRAVPQMQAIHVGLPAKLLVGILVLGFGLPGLVAGVNAGVGHALQALDPIFRP